MIKKITSVEDLNKFSPSFIELFKEDNEKYGHALNLKHDYDLILKSIAHESLLLWNIHVWASINKDKCDGIFIGIIRKSEKFNKKMMDEYLWLAKNTNSGFSLYKEALDFAKKQGCDFVSLNVVENHPLSKKLKNIYTKLGFQKDCESYIKKLN
jgi:hypothetical protein